MTNITNMYFNYAAKSNIMQLEGGNNMIIGLCGKSGSGKSTIAKAIVESKPNAMHYEVDKIGHQVMTIKEVQVEAIKCFGNQITTDGTINRKKLAEIVFSSRERMEELTNITWKHMKAVLDKIIQDSEGKVTILDWILLSATPYFDMCDLKILVDIPYEIRKKRAMARDNITSEEFDLREQASIEYDVDKFNLVVSCHNINDVKRLVNEI